MIGQTPGICELQETHCEGLRAFLVQGVVVEAWQLFNILREGSVSW